MSKKSNLIYLDHAATTPLDARVRVAMEPYLSAEFGNASTLYALGQRARGAVDRARETVAEILHCSPREIIFTSGGTEADNLALRGILRRHSGDDAPPIFPGNTKYKILNTKYHLITTNFEHHAILHTAEDLEADGVETTYLPVNEVGQISVEQVRNAIQPNTRLVSVMYANNEIGTILPIREIGKMLEKLSDKSAIQNQQSKILFHTDAVQAGGALELDVRHLKVDLLSLSGHKFYGPKGVGILYVRDGVSLRPTQTGGGQEHRRRAGTENVAGIVGFATALALAHATREKENARLEKLRDYLSQRLLTEIPKTRLNGDAHTRLPNNMNVSFWGIEGESILLRLDFEKICGSSGSACTSGTLDPSHVLLALGLPPAWAHGSLRLTLGKTTTKKDLDIVVQALKKIVADLRAISPIE